MLRAIVERRPMQGSHTLEQWRYSYKKETAESRAAPRTGEQGIH